MWFGGREGEEEKSEREIKNQRTKRKPSSKKERRKRENMEIGACISRTSFLSLMTFPFSKTLLNRNPRPIRPFL